MRLAQITLENAILSEVVRNNKNERITKLFESTLEQLNTAMECNILCETLVDPVILKSGNTISGVVFQGLERDPFDNTKDCKERIPNLLAKEVIEIIKNSKKRLQTLLLQQNVPISNPPPQQPPNLISGYRPQPNLESLNEVSGQLANSHNG